MTTSKIDQTRKMVNWRQHRYFVSSRESGVMHHVVFEMPSGCGKRVMTNLLLLLKLGGSLLAGLLLALALLQESLWDENLVLGRDGSSAVSPVSSIHIV